MLQTVFNYKSCVEQISQTGATCQQSSSTLNVTSAQDTPGYRVVHDLTGSMLLYFMRVCNFVDEVSQ